MKNSNQITTKRFIIRKSLIGTKTIVNVEFKSGKTAVYNHDEVYEVMKDKLNAMNCFAKYKSYTSSTSVPVIARHLVK
jgi:hypothetical protein|tara:strand:+ start:426 stop:659 length:234 start_codon:yes stop_codon:yes gene_type:complete